MATTKTQTEKKITWQTKSGKQATVEVTMQTTETAYADGYNVEIPCCELNISGDVDGSLIESEITRKVTDLPGGTYHAQIGRLLIPDKYLAEIDAAIAEIYATPEWRAKIQAKKASKMAVEEYEKHQQLMRDVMGE